MKKKFQKDKKKREEEIKEREKVKLTEMESKDIFSWLNCSSKYNWAK